MVTIAKNLSSAVKLNDGVFMPLFGLGTYRALSDDGKKAFLYALQNGYRMLDTAEVYGNEEDVGSAVKQCGQDRKDVFVVSKVWTNGYENCKKAFTDTLRKLDIGYVDLYLIHSPLGGRVVETYKAMLEFQKEGLVRSCCVSNFGIQHLKGLEESGLPRPSVNQIELNPWQQKNDIVKYCREKGIGVMGFCPLVRKQTFNDSRLQSICKRRGKTPAQVLLRWAVQNGYITIPKSSNPGRISENADVFNWSLQEEDMDLLGSCEEDYVCDWNPCVSAWEG